jgi:excisionase family DNA binding protein
MENKLISIKEASEMLGVSKLTLRNWDRDGKLSALRHPINNYRVYNLEDIEKIIAIIKSGEKPIRAPHKKKTKFRIVPVMVMFRKIYHRPWWVFLRTEEIKVCLRHKDI